MRDVLTADRPCLEMRWVPVADDQGRVRPQAVWIEAGAEVSSTPSATAHHAA